MGTSNGHTLIIGTSDGLYKAEHGADGYTSKKVGLSGLGDFRAGVVVDCNDPAVMYAGTVKAGMFRSRDGGESWQEINAGLLHKTVWSITQHQESGDLYVGASPASVFISKDQGDITSLGSFREEIHSSHDGFVEGGQPSIQSDPVDCGSQLFMVTAEALAGHNFFCK